VIRLFQGFWSDEAGRGGFEYARLLLFVALVSAALFLAMGGKVQAVRGTSTSQIAAAAIGS